MTFSEWRQFFLPAHGLQPVLDQLFGIPQGCQTFLWRKYRFKQRIMSLFRYSRLTYSLFNQASHTFVRIAVFRWSQALRDPVSGTPSVAYPPDVLKAIQQAKEANQNVNWAQHKVAEAKQAAIVQQKVALAKEAAAREAAAR